MTFIALLIVMDQFIGFCLAKLYFSQKTGQNQSLTYIIKNCMADVVVFGNSRAQPHYISKLISDSLNLSCYNAVIDGGHSILLQATLIDVLTKRYSPKIIILEFDPQGIVHFPGDYDRLSVLLPYVSGNPEILSTVLLRSIYERVKLQSSIYPFNSQIINIIRFNTSLNAARKKDFDGYVPIVGTMNFIPSKFNADLLYQETKKQDIDSNMIVALKKISHRCKEKNIRLYIFNSPTYNKINPFAESSSSVEIASMKIIQENQIHFFNFSHDSTFRSHYEWLKTILT
jgi:hypothetical protein